MSNVASRTYKKERVLQLWSSFHTPKSLPKKIASGTGKQHGLASSRTSFSDLRWSELQCQTSRPEPVKKTGFCSFGAHFAPCVGFEMHIDLSPKSLPKKAASGTGKQHGLASSRTSFSDLRWGELQCQTSRPEPIKRRGFCSFGAHFTPPKAFPKRLPPERGNSMAWRAQGHRFRTCVGVSCSVKRRVQNL